MDTRVDGRKVGNIGIINGIKWRTQERRLSGIPSLMIEGKAGRRGGVPSP